MIKLKTLPIALVLLTLSACGGGGGGTTTPPITPPPGGGGGGGGGTPATVTVSGKATYDSVLHDAVTNALDYNNIQALPIRGAVIEALDSSGAVLQTSNTDENGDYTFTINSNTTVRIRVKAHLLQTSGATWDVKSTDNTNGNALYVMDGAAASTGTANSTRNLNAASGWGGTSYTATRTAAPFAIIDPIYDAVQKFAQADSAIAMPAMEFRWSTSNKAASGDRTVGDIGTSSYIGNGQVYILGDANSDTDEYDTHVVVHEWGHYFEDQLSRADSIGGSHGGGDRLDPRVAFGEGWGNALSGMITDDPIYRDSFGNQQGNGFSINVDGNAANNEGWFNEGSVQSILYDLYDSNDDGQDTVSLGLGPIYDVLKDAAYTGNDYFTTIFSFTDLLKTQQAGDVAGINALLTNQTINGTGADGTGETNDGGVATSIPVYKPITVGGAAVNICSTDNNGNYNKLGNRSYLQLDIGADATYTILMTRTSGDTSRDPDFVIWKKGVRTATAETAPAETESFTGALTTGIHIIEAYDFLNVSSNTSTDGDSCYDITVTQ